MQGVVATPGAGFGPGTMLPVSMLPPLPVLRCGCVKGADGMGRLISTELCCEGGNLSSHGWMEGLAGA